MGNILLSVIIPVYNGEKYLSRCLKSVLNQSYDTLEIILVNDGSTDGTLSICEEYQKNEKRIHTVSIENSGSYQARKYGALCAKGEVLTFIDADDYIDMDAYKNMMEIYQTYLPDVISYTFQINDMEEACENYFESGIYNREKIEKYIIPKMMFDVKTGQRGLNPSVACKIVKRQLFLDLAKEVAGRIVWGDDALVTYPLICKAKSIYIEKKPYYHYFMNGESCTHTVSSTVVEELKKFRQILSDMLNKYFSGVDWNFQIDSYMRTYAEMLLKNWFGIHRMASMYIFPYHLIHFGCRIKIYGAGEVGKSYIVDLLQTNYADVIGWYDKEKFGESYCQVPILDPKSIKESDADYIVVAIEKGIVADKIIKELINCGISKEKIKWEKPILRA